jgi:hypothetical protein
MEVVRRRRLSRGEPYAEVERALGHAERLLQLLALALFDDVERSSDVLPRLKREAGPPLAEALKQCDEGAGGPGGVDAAAALELVRQSSKLAAWLRGLA